MTQQEASVPSAAGRKPEQLLPKTFGSTFNLTKGHFGVMVERCHVRGATNGPHEPWFLLEKF